MKPVRLVQHFAVVCKWTTTSAPTRGLAALERSKD